MDNLTKAKEAIFSWLASGNEGHTLSNDYDDTLDFSEIRKALIETERFPKYYAVKENIIISLGFNIDGQDVERGEHDLVGRYGLFIVRRHSDGRPSFDFELLDDDVSTADAQDQAVTLVENAKNNVVNVRVGIGVAWTFASRPIFKGTIAFFRVARGVEGFTEEEKFDELEKAGTEAQTILFPKNKFSVSEARTWLKGHGKGSGKVDSPANFHRFRQFDPGQCGGTPKTISFGGSGVKAVICVKKAQPTAQDVHVDQNVQGKDGKKKKKKLTTPSQSVKYDVCQCGCIDPFTQPELEEMFGEKAQAMVEKAKLTTAARNKLPRSAFAFVDSKGVGHFPIHDKAHVRNALARVSQSPFGARALPKIRAAAKKFGIGEPAKKEQTGEEFSFEVEIHKADIDRGLIYGVVYEPFKRDSHGDHTSPEEIERAAHGFLPNSLTNVDHKDDSPEVEVVESFIAPCDFAYKANGAKSMDTDKVLKGAWVLVTKVHDDKLLESIRSGERTGYSLEGTAQKL